MFEVHIYISTDQKSPRPARRKYGYILETRIRGELRTRKGFGSIEGTYHRTVLTALAEAMGRINQSCRVHIHTEDTFILNMLRNNVHKWVENDFKEDIANKKEWQQLWKMAAGQEIFTEPGSHSYDAWLKSEMAKMPSHTVNSR